MNYSDDNCICRAETINPDCPRHGSLSHSCRGDNWIIVTGKELNEVKMNHVDGEYYFCTESYKDFKENRVYIRSMDNLCWLERPEIPHSYEYNGEQK